MARRGLGPSISTSLGSMLMRASRATTPVSSASRGLISSSVIAGQSTTSCDSRVSASAIATRSAGRLSRYPSSSLKNACLTHEVAGKLAIKRRECHRRVVDDLGRGAASAKQDHGSEQAILVDAHQKLMRFRAHDHWPHGEALQTCLRTELVCVVMHPLCGRPGLLS